MSFRNNIYMRLYDHLDQGDPMIYTVLVVLTAVATISYCAFKDYRAGYLSNPFKN